jgi:hypothetical protein
MEMSVLLIIFLVLILSIVLYYGLVSVDMGPINDDYVIPVAILFLLITTGGFTGNNGFTGDFGLDYCNDKDSVTGYTEETELEVVHPESFFACELGYIDGIVDLGWILSVPTSQVINDEIKVMILNHENYKKYVNGETYGVSNFHLSELQSSVGAGESSEYEVGIRLYSDTYFFVIARGYDGTERGLIGPNSPTGSTANPLYFYYMVDLDYDTSGVVTTN